MYVIVYRNIVYYRLENKKKKIKTERRNKPRIYYDICTYADNIIII